MKAQIPAKNNSPVNNPIESVMEFTLKNRKPISVITVIALVVVSMVGLFLFFSSSQTEKANEIYDQAISTINSLQNVTNQQMQIKYYNEAINSLNSLIQTHPNSTASVRARLLMGRIYFDESLRSGKPESLSAAVNYYNGILAVTKSEYYNALAYLGLAQCHEQKNEYDKAYEYYGTVVSKYPKEGFNPYALIGMARCKEIKEDYNSALQLYRKVATEYTNSLWVRYAKGKIYYFNSPVNTTTNTQKVQQTNVPFIMPQ